ncbi:MAG: hypothetical protein L0K10_01915 [Brevibacterium aurantiacum]|nr:hypothetical protein [Brevibacterium aurantiacum]
MATTEIESLEAAFRSAQARLGIATGLLTRDEWMALNPTNPDRGSYGMMMRILRGILGLRSASRRLTKSYYRLARALEIGRTLGEDTEPTTLDQLREEFQNDLEQIQTLDFGWEDQSPEERYAASELGELSRSDPASFESGELDDSLAEWIDSIVSDDGEVRTDRVEWTNDRIQSLEDAVESFRKLIGDNGIRAIKDRIKTLKRKYGDDPDRLLAEIDDAFVTVRDILAGVVDKIVMDSGRELVDNTVDRDISARWFARGVRSNPCHFCSMLASRGFVYRSERAAIRGTHPNCHCFPIVRWGDSPDLPEQNSYYQKMWDEVTADYIGKDKVKAWRRWIAKRRVKRGGKL